VRAFAVELRAIQAYLRDDVPAYARKVTCPTLVLHGSKDRVVPLAWGKALADLITTARMRCIVGVGHNPVASSVDARRMAI